MRRVWASVLSVWALLALVAVLAWTRAPTPVSQQGARVVVVHTANGPRRLLLAPAAHATTQTSGSAPQRQQAVLSGQAVPSVSSPSAGGNNR
jgi:cyanate permease